MDSNLTELLRRLNQNGRNDSTHLTFFPQRDKYCIPNGNLCELWEGYCDLVERGTKNLCLAELSIPQMPIVVKACLQFEASCAADDIDDFIYRLVYQYQRIIAEIFNIQSTLECIAVVLGPDDGLINPNTGLFEKRFQVRFPFSRSERSVQTNVVHPLACRYLRECNALGLLPVGPVNTLENIISMNVAEEPIELYGSTDVSGLPTLTAYTIYGHLSETQATTGSNLPEYDLAQVFTPAYHEHFRSGIIPSGMCNNYELFYWLPMFLSVNYSPNILLTRQDIPLIQPSTPNRVMSTSPSIMSSPSETALGRAQEFVRMLSRDRVEADNYWIDVGKSLYTAAGGDQRGLDLWISFTEQSDNHTAEECQIKYYTFNTDNCLTDKTLAWYARTDSPELYAAWHRKWCLTARKNAASSQTHNDVAEIFYRIYWLDFACHANDANKIT